MGPTDKSTICPLYLNDDKTVLCRMCMNAAAIEMKPPANADHVRWDFGRPNEQTHATHANSQELFIQR